jgi:hypothetical protein
VVLEKILRVTQTYSGTTCFDIIEEKKEALPLQLCAETKEEMDEWIVGILEFKECLLKDKFQIIDANANAFKKEEKKKADIKKDIKQGKGIVPTLAKGKLGGKGKGIGGKGKGPNPSLSNSELPFKPPTISPETLYYTNSFTPSTEIVEITETDETLTKILNDKKREEIAQRQIRREIEDKIRKVKEAHQKILLQEKKMVKKNAVNKKKQIAVATQKIEDQAKKMEKQILSNALKSMQQMNKQDLQEFKVTISKPIVEYKKKTRSQIQRIMKMAEASKVNQPFDECLNNRLEGFKDLDYVKEVCQKMYGQDLCETCENKENFCQKCCGHRVGTQFATKLAKCNVQCNALIS